MRNNGLQALKRDIEARGFFKKDTRRVLIELAAFLCVFVASLVTFLAVDQLLVKAVALGIFTLSTFGITANTHTSSHYATSQHRRLNELLTYFGYPFLVGFSATYWRHKHLVVHHPAPNVIGVDDDANLLPFFALNTAELQRLTLLKRLYYRLQWVVIPFAIFGNSFSLEVAGWRHLLGALRSRVRRRPEHWIDLGALVLQWLCWIIVPLFFFAAVDVLVFYVLRRGLFSYVVFAAFAPAHFPDEALFVDRASQDVDFVLLQTSTTINFKTGPLGRLLCAGVEYQIEHHLFPGISHTHYPEVSKMVKAYCDAHGYPYRTLGWGEAVMKSLLVFYRPKTVRTLATT